MLFDALSDGLSFPYFHSEPFHLADIKSINEYFYKKYNLFTNVLKCWKKGNSRLIYEVEVLNMDILHTAKYIEWADPFSHRNFNKISVKDQWILQHWKEEDSNQMPWFEYGFREEIGDWIERKLSGRLDSIEQVRTWEKGLLLKIYGFNNNYYVKTVPPIFDYEPFVHQGMSEYVPEVVSIDEKRNTYMMREIEGGLLGYSRDIQHWKTTVRRIARLQKKFIQGELKIGTIIPKRPMETVLTEKQLNKAIKALQNYISNTSYQKLLKSIPDILSLVEKLELKSLLSVDHGDLFGGNVIVEDGKPLIYDWSNSSITHPFLSIVHLVEEASDLFSENQSEAVLIAYLYEWEDYGQTDKVISEFVRVQLLQPIYYIVVHMLIIFPAFRDNVDKEEIIDSYITKWLVNIDKINTQI